MKFVRDEGGRPAEVKTGARDCVVRAIAIASERPYQMVHDELTYLNGTTASNGIKVQREWFKRYMQSLGFVWTPTMLVGQGCKVHLRDGELPMGRLVVNVSRHLVAVIDGVVHDIFNPSRSGTRCVYGYWRKTTNDKRC